MSSWRVGFSPRGASAPLSDGGAEAPRGLKPTLQRTLVIGYGNPLRGDDAIGYIAAEQLSSTLNCKALHQLTPELAADLAETDLAIFIDAACDNERGEIACRRVLPEGASAGGFTHQLTPEVLLGLTERLYGSCPDAILFSVGADSFGYGEDLSEPVRAALPSLLERVQAASAATQS